MPEAPLLVRADSVTSLVAHRYGSAIPEDVRGELLAVSAACRALADRDELAAAVAERWWPGRYLGDLTTREWERVYSVLDPVALPSFQHRPKED